MSLKKSLPCIVLVVLGTLLSCSSDDNAKSPSNNFKDFELNFDFNKDGISGWIDGYADLPKNGLNAINHKFELKNLPNPLNQSQKAVYQYGHNRSDDLFMYMKRKIKGLKPNHTYKAIFNIEIASNAAEGSVGVGGSPAESVYIKAGLTTKEPKENVVDQSNHVRMNIDKGNQGTEGKDMIILGNFSNGTNKFEYALKTLNSKNKTFEATTNANGELWLIVGTDSAFEAATGIYYTRVSVDLQ